MSEENKYILQVKDLHTSFATDAGEVRAVNGEIGRASCRERV